MPAGLSEQAAAAAAAAASSACLSVPGTVTMAPALLTNGSVLSHLPPSASSTLPPSPLRSTPVPLNTKAPISLSLVTAASQPLVKTAPLGTLVTKLATVNTVPKTNSGPRLPAPQIVAAKAPSTTTIQLPANFQLSPGTVLIRSNSGQLMLVSQQALAQAETRSPVNVRATVPSNTHAVKICTVANSSTQLIKKVAVAPVKTVAPVRAAAPVRAVTPVKAVAPIKAVAAPVKTVAQLGSTVVTSFQKPSIVQSVAAPASVVTVTPVKPLNTVTSLKTSVIGTPAAPLQDSTQKVEIPAAAQAGISVEMLENVTKCKNFLAMLIKLACSGAQSPEMGQNVKKLVENLLDAKIEPEEFTKKLYIELKSSPQPHLVPFLKKSVTALRQLMPNSQSFIEQCVQQSPPQVVIPTCATVTHPPPVVTTTISSIHMEKPLLVSAAPTVGTVSIQTASPVAGPGGVGVVTFHSGSPVTGAGGSTVGAVHPVNPASVPGGVTSKAVTLHSVSSTTSPAGVTAGTVFLQPTKPLVTCGATTVATVSLQPEKPLVPGAAVTLSLPPTKPTVTSGEVVGPSISLPPSKPVVNSGVATSASVKPVIGPPIHIKLTQPGSFISQPASTPQTLKVKQLVVQQPSGGIVKQVTALPHSSALTIQKSGQKRMPLNTLIQTNQFPTASILKQITLPGNKILSLQAPPVQKNKIKENGTTSFRDEDDINDVTSMAGVNLSEENACILAANSELVGTLTRSHKEEPFLFTGALQKRILDIGKRHDIMELNSDVVNLISHATQERLRGLIEKLTIIAQHRMTTCKESENYVMSSDTRSQLRFLEKLDHIEKQRKDEEEREMLLRAAKSRSNKEDPEQLRLKQKAKEMQQLELAQMQQRDANITALAAIGPRKKRPLDSVVGSGTEGLNGNALASGSSSLTVTRQLFRPRITRVCLRDLIFYMEQEKGMKYSRALYHALLK
ncbi:LOW QUALITY PROTEIN: transcription initiation factor TFIID subunit 4B [Phascolarctos cinereus]|uniref:LOW QUALITY PROTEIN: transcription initiation factor TFIID subunit 4B n=1 Tax=Phascolarctos cinereus TaxID=38626 RepID=A0A6P5ITK5_PHACI|nr:LOW QUALITY PROTEIN: transcription initiation factor TFIID subunit 4B [Phascolarctos cinereus]